MVQLHTKSSSVQRCHNSTVGGAKTRSFLMVIPSRLRLKTSTGCVGRQNGRSADCVALTKGCNGSIRIGIASEEKIVSKKKHQLDWQRRLRLLRWIGKETMHIFLEIFQR